MLRYRKPLSPVALIAAALLAPAGRSQQPGWEHLGMRPVNFRVDHDVITAGLRGRFRAVRLVVDGGDLEMFDVKFTFGDGETWSPALRFYFKEGTRTRTLHLPGAARVIRRIDFFYKSVPGGGQGRATVHAYAHS